VPHDLAHVLHVLVLAETRLYRDGLAAILGQSGALRVSADNASTRALSARIEDADVVVVDAVDGPDSIDDRIGGVDVPVVAVGVPDDEDEIVAFAEAGVIGFVERNATLEELLTAIELAAHRQASCSPRVLTTVIRRLAALAGRATQAPAPALTARERQIVQLIAEGLSNKEIAHRLCIEVATVKNHVHNILEKLQVNRRDEAVALLQVVHDGSPESAMRPVAALAVGPRPNSA
jgi:DNA-binding NarL/FixJ family response regulator